MGKNNPYLYILTLILGSTLTVALSTYATSIGNNVSVTGTLSSTGALSVTTTSATSTLSTGGLTIGTSQFIVQQTSGRVGIGTASPSHLVDIQGGTLATGQSAIRVTATQSSTAPGSNISFTTTTAGSDAARRIGLTANMSAGYTGQSSTFGISVQNSAASTGANPFNIVSGGASFAGGNVGVRALTDTTTIGTNTGGHFRGENGALNFGVWGQSTSANNSATNIGISGWALNTGTSAFQIGGYFGLQSSLPTLATSSALMADNGGTNSNIFVARNNGSAVFSIVNGGNVGIATDTPWGLLSVNANNITGPEFAVGSTTGTSFIVSNGGQVGVGTTTPSTNGDLVVDSTSATSTLLLTSGGSTKGGCIQFKSPTGLSLRAYATTTGPLILEPGSCK